MLRRHLETVIFLALSILAAILYGLALTVFGFTRHAPLWLTVGACLFTGIVIAVIAESISRAVAKRQAGRARSHVEGPKPTNPDGTPYGYHQIRAGGWEHCDGCGLWGRTWTPENPHHCQETYTHRPITNRKASQ